MSADALVEDRLPGVEGKAKAAVGAQNFEHGKAAAGEIGRADQCASDIVACVDRLEGSSEGGRHLLSDPLDLRPLNGGPIYAVALLGVDGDVAIGRPGPGGGGVASTIMPRRTFSTREGSANSM